MIDGAYVNTMHMDLAAGSADAVGLRDLVKMNKQLNEFIDICRLDRTRALPDLGIVDPQRWPAAVQPIE